MYKYNMTHNKNEYYQLPNQRFTDPISGFNSWNLLNLSSSWPWAWQKHHFNLDTLYNVHDQTNLFSINLRLGLGTSNSYHPFVNPCILFCHFGKNIILFWCAKWINSWKNIANLNCKFLTFYFWLGAQEIICQCDICILNEWN